MSTSTGIGIGTAFGGSAPFDPSSIKVDGEKTLQQQLLVKQAPTIDGVIYDESKNKGDARPEQLRQFRKLNGTTQYGSVADNPDLDITNNLSVVVWAKNDDALISANETLMAKYATVGNLREWWFRFNADEKLSFVVSGDGSDVGSWVSTNPVAISASNTYGFTFESGVIKFYVNGVEIPSGLDSGTVPTSIFNGSTPLTIGAMEATSPATYFDGDIYEARIYDTTILTASEMLDIHNNPTLHATVGGRLVAHYKLDNNASEVILDSSGNANHGLWINAPTKSTGGAVHSWANDVGYSGAIYLNNGITQHVDFSSHIVNFTSKTKGKIEFDFFVDPSSSGARRIFILSNTALGSDDFFVSVEAGGALSVFKRNNATTVLSFSTNLTWNDRRMHTAVLEVTDAGNTFTVDGVAVALTYTVGSASTKQWFNNASYNFMGVGIGKDNGGFEAGFGGVIKNVKVYDEDGATLLLNTAGRGNTTADWVDTSGNNYNGTVVGSPSILYIPRNESVPTQDVLGNPLQYTGRVPYNAKAEQSNCVTLNGSSQYGQITGLTASANYFGACTISMEINVTDTTTAQAIWALGAAAYRIYINAGVWTLNAATSTGVSVTTGIQKVSVTYNASGEAISFSLNDAVVWTGTAPVGTFATTIFFIGARDLSGTPGLFFNGSVWNFSITGSSVKNFSFPMSCGAGTTCADVSGGGSILQFINAPTWGKQDRYHYNLVNGHNKLMNWDGANDVAVLPTAIRTDLGGKGKVGFKAKVFIPTYPASVTNAMINVPINSSASGFTFGVSPGGDLRIAGRRISTDSFAAFTTPITPGFHEVEGYLDYQNQQYGMRIDGGAWVTGATSFASGAGNYTTGTPSSNATLGSVDTVANTFWAGLMFECELYLDDVLTNRWNGYDNTVSAWADTVGSRSVTSLSGTPARIYIPAKNATQDVFDEVLRSPAGAYHNGAETLIDFTNNVLSPEAVRNSWETAWTFNTARTNPEFKRTLTQDSVAHRADRFLAYRDALSGSNLTKVEKYTLTKAI